MEKISVKNLWQKHKTKIAGVGTGILLAAGNAAAAFRFSGMGNLSDFLKDVADLVPDIITLAIYGVVLFVVSMIGRWVAGFINSGIIRKK